jgi:2-succinyl-5-enolpyruvyl-6-hydroxy-3-cyclohexene-1-carboxylate synthase
MLHDRLGIELLAELMDQRGIHYLVISPGSRNAPIINAFCRRPGMRCLSVVDERSAAFFALGMAQQLKKPVAIACTSGSAPLNFAPAIAEAYYQETPLLVLTADRPVEFIDQGDGQTIRQNNLFANYIRQSFQLPQSIKTNDELWHANRIVSEALNACTYPVPGPVHINLPFTEPLYGNRPEKPLPPKDFLVEPLQHILSKAGLEQLAETWNNSSKKLVLAGQLMPDKRLDALLAQLAKDPSVVVLTETTSNLNGEAYIAWVDRCLGALPREKDAFAPDVLLTIGGSVVSKRIKGFLREAKIAHHWHVHPAQVNMDTYQQLTNAIPMAAADFLSQMMPLVKPVHSNFSDRWQQLSAAARKGHQQFLSQCPWSDLKIFQVISENIPEGTHIQLANSTPVRYAQLFDYPHPYRFDSNRGTSGIDGGLSTAAGAAFASGKPTLMITGDLGFFYDSNALWNKHLPPNLKIIMINNEGGGIFRYIEGPDQTGFLEEFFETRHKTSAEHIALAFGVDYQYVQTMEQLQPALEKLFQPAERAAMLEIQSPAEVSARVLKDYFKALQLQAQSTE